MKIDKVYIITMDTSLEYKDELFGRAWDLPLPSNTEVIFKEGFLGKNLLERPQDYPEYRLYPNWNLGNPDGWWWWQRPALSGEAGGMISHTQCWEDAYENEYETIMIIEDDFTLLEPIPWEIFDEMDDYDWDLCLMSHNSLHDSFSDIPRPQNIGKEHFIKPTFFYNTHTYILRSKGIVKLVEDHLPVLKQNIIVSDEFLSAVISSHPRPDLREMYISNINAIATKTNYTGQSRSEAMGNSLTETER